MKKLCDSEYQNFPLKLAKYVLYSDMEYDGIMAQCTDPLARLSSFLGLDLSEGHQQPMQ